MKNILFIIINWICNRLPINRKKIFFMSYYGSQYGCNPKYLSEYFVKNLPEWDVVWAFTEPDKHEHIGIRKVRYMSMRFFYELCTSKALVTNYRMIKLYKKRKEQIYIQTWHSSLRLKMIESDAEQSLPPHYVDMAKRDSKQISALLSGCRFSTEIFKRCFWYNGPIIPSGTPREDLLFSDNVSLKRDIRLKLGVGMNAKLLLYAPTFRKDYSLRYYNIQFGPLIETLHDKWGGEWIVILRLHPHLKDFSKLLMNNDKNIVDATSYDDIQELLYVADAVISDYSSLIFDFAITRRPCLLYVPDLAEYTEKDRTLYFDIDKLPFPKCQNHDQLLKCIETFNRNEYIAKVDAFMQQIGSYETGNSCENVAQYIIENV